MEPAEVAIDRSAADPENKSLICLRSKFLRPNQIEAYFWSVVEELKTKGLKLENKPSIKVNVVTNVGGGSKITDYKGFSYIHCPNSEIVYAFNGLNFDGSRRVEQFFEDVEVEVRTEIKKSGSHSDPVVKGKAWWKDDEDEEMDFSKEPQFVEAVPRPQSAPAVLVEKKIERRLVKEVDLPVLVGPKEVKLEADQINYFKTHGEDVKTVEVAVAKMFLPDIDFNVFSPVTLATRVLPAEINAEDLKLHMTRYVRDPHTLQSHEFGEGEKIVDTYPLIKIMHPRCYKGERTALIRFENEMDAKVALCMCRNFVIRKDGKNHSVVLVNAYRSIAEVDPYRQKKAVKEAPVKAPVKPQIKNKGEDRVKRPIPAKGNTFAMLPDGQ